ncbi:MAG: SDR family NAD(P)-dependent oxidoreductase [Bacteroidia bacterium]
MRSLVIGASGGIGSALSHLLEERGEVYRTSHRQRLANAISLDVTDELEVHSFFQDVPPLDVLIYAVGKVEKAPIRDLSRSALDEVMGANLIGAFLVLKHARFVAGARAIFIGAYPDYVRIPGFSVYAASKAGLEALLDVARKELRRENVHLTLVRLPAVATGLWKPLGGPPKNALEPLQAAQKILTGAFQDPPPPLLEL